MTARIEVMDECRTCHSLKIQMVLARGDLTTVAKKAARRETARNLAAVERQRAEYERARRDLVQHEASCEGAS